jgi:hypothetical protein
LNPTKIRNLMWGFILLGILSLLLTGASIPGILGSQIGVNPSRILKIIALISLLSAVVSYIKYRKVKMIEAIYFFYSSNEGVNLRRINVYFC